MLVLPRGAYEIEPSIEYTYRGSDALELVDVAGAVQIARHNVKQDRLEAAVALRAGLAGAAHVEVRVPYVLVRDDRTTADQIGRTVHESGAGDVELGFTKQLMQERPGRLGLLGAVNWKAPTGRFRVGEASTGSGFHALQGALTGVKREDPLVFFAAASYTFVRERRLQGDDIDPGDAIGLKFGTMLSASPRTSIRGGFELSRSGRTQVNGTAVPGSDAAVGVLQFGLATLLSRRSLLDVQLSVGVTPDAPDFALIASLPIRFP